MATYSLEYECSNSFAHNSSQIKKRTKRSIDRWMDKQIVAYSCNRMPLSNKKSFDVLNARISKHYAEWKKSNTKENVYGMTPFTQKFMKCILIYRDRKQIGVCLRLGVEDRTDTKWQKETFVWVEMYLGCCGGFTGVHIGENSSNITLTMGVVCCM